MKYRYVAIDADGKKVKSIVEAENETAAIYHIRNQDLNPVSVSPYKEKAGSIWEFEIMEPEVHSWDMSTGTCSICGISNAPVKEQTFGNFLVSLWRSLWNK